MTELERTSATEPALYDASTQRDRRHAEALLCIFKQKAHALLVYMRKYGDLVLDEVGRTAERERQWHALVEALEAVLTATRWPAAAAALTQLSAVVQRLVIREMERERAKRRTRHG